MIHIKRLVSFFLILATLLPMVGCQRKEAVQIAATTLPVYDFTNSLCQDTGLKVAKLVTEEVSCLHDYTLQVDQTKILEQAELVVISGAGLESFLPDIDESKLVDASVGITLHDPNAGVEHTHEHNDHEHHHNEDPHIWLSVQNAKVMCSNILDGLINKYPEHKETIERNYILLQSKLTDLEKYAETQLSQITHKKLITFHDGFHYLAESLDLSIIHAIEEESGSEASANELKQLILLVREHELPAIFTERSGSTSAADVIARETKVPIYTLDMAMSGDSYFDAMYHNIDTLKEALE